MTTDVITGFRPTGNLTVANYLAAVKPTIDLQDKGLSILVFVADLHAITDIEPEMVSKYRYEIVADYLALGLDPSKLNIYMQTDIMSEILELTAYLSRLMNVSELLRVPTLKDKIKNQDKPESANALLFMYPLIMAADILINQAKKVPVGEDQIAHIEVTQKLARKFNAKYGDVFTVPKALQVKSLRLLSLKGEGKMSKTNPAGALFLTDDEATIAKKIKTAETAFEGEMNDRLESHILIAKGLAKSGDDIKKIDEIITEHKSGKQVMGDFKKEYTYIVQGFLSEFQQRRSEIVKDEKLIPDILDKGRKVAKANARETLEAVRKALKF